MEIFKLFGSVFVNTEEAEKSIGKVDKKGQELAKSTSELTGKVNKVAAGVAGVGAAVGAGLFALVNNTAQTADEIDKMSERTGIGRERLQELKYAAGQCGVEFNSIENGVKTLTKNMGKADEESKRMVEAFGSLGVEVNGANGELKSSSDLFEESIMKLAGMEDQTQRNILGQKIFGGSWQEMIPLINQGEDGIKALTDRAGELGLVMSEENVKANVVFGDTLADVKDSLGSIWVGLANDLLPAFQKLLDWILNNMPQIKETAGKILDALGDSIKWVTDNSDWLIPVLGGVLGAILALNAINGLLALQAAWKASTFAMTLAQGGLNAALLANPIGLIVVAIGVLVAAGIYLWKNWDTISVKLKAIWQGIKEVASGVFDGIKGAIKGMVNGVIGALNSMIRGLNRIKFNVPSWVPLLGGKSFGFNIGEIPAYAKGTDYAKGGYALVGEQGPEVVELPRGSKVNNNEESEGLMSGISLKIENFYNNREQDIKALAEELEFYRKQRSFA